MKTQSLLEAAKQLLHENKSDQILRDALKNPKNYFLHLGSDISGDFYGKDQDWARISKKNERGKYFDFSEKFFSKEYENLLSIFKKMAPKNIEWPNDEPYYM